MKLKKKKKKQFEICNFIRIVFKLILNKLSSNIFKNYLHTYFFLITGLFLKNYKIYLFRRFNLRKNLFLFIAFNHKYVWFAFNFKKKKGKKRWNIFFKFGVIGKFDKFLKLNSNLKIINRKIKIIHLIKLKKKFGFFKKSKKLNHYYMYRLNFFRNFIFSRFLKKKKWSKKKRKFNRFNSIRRSHFSVFFENRRILKNLIFSKKIKQYKTTKFFSKLIKLDFKGFLDFFQFSLLGVLIKLKFCHTFTESLFLIKNGKIFVNGIKVFNPYFKLCIGDFIQIKISKVFFNFFKINIGKKIKLLNSLKYFIWKNNRLKNNFYKQPYTKVPKWVSDLKYFHEDVPRYLDVDYSTLSACVICKPLYLSSLKDINLKFLNIFMLRNYNWSYLS